MTRWEDILAALSERIPETFTPVQLIWVALGVAALIGLRSALAMSGLWPTRVADPETLARRAEWRRRRRLGFWGWRPFG